MLTNRKKKSSALAICWDSIIFFTEAVTFFNILSPVSGKGGLESGVSWAFSEHSFNVAVCLEEPLESLVLEHTDAYTLSLLHFAVLCEIYF